jgi:hypothetical protein
MERDDRTHDRVETVKEDVRDTVDEMKERVKAGAEKAKRAVEGEQMPLGERIASNVKEKADEMRADFDKTKREARDRTETDVEGGI